MLIWNLPTELYCYLDTDLLCINDARGLLKFQHFSVAPDGVGKNVRMFSWRRPHTNTGFMVYRPTLS